MTKDRSDEENHPDNSGKSGANDEAMEKPGADDRERLDLLRRVEQVARVGAWEIETETNELSWTKQTYRVFEVPLDQAPDLETALQFYAPEGRAQLRTALARCRDHGEPYDLELPIITAENNRRWVRSRGEAQYDDGNVVRLIGTVQDVTEKHEMKRQIREQNQWLESITENIGEGLYRTTPDDGLVYANRAFVDIFGYDSLDEVLALAPGSLFAAPEQRAELLHVADREEEAAREVQFRRKDGSTFTGRLSGSVIRDDDGEIQFVDGSVADISTLKKRERELEETRALYRSVSEDVLNNVPVGTIIFDAASRVVWVSQAIENYFGMSRGDLIGKGRREVHREEICRVMENPGRFVETVEASNEDSTGTEIFECHVISGMNRDERWLKHRSKPIEQGLYEGGSVEIYTDITERKERERELQKTSERLRAILDASPDAIFALDRSGDVEFWNPAAERIFGWTEEEVLGQPLPIVQEEKTGEYERFFARVQSGEMIEGVEVRRQRKDGTLIDVNLSAAPLQDEDGDVVGIMAVIEDITERKKQERRLKAVFNQTFQFTGVMRPDGIMLEVNDTALEFGGIVEEDVLGKPLWESRWAQTGDESKRKLREAIDRAAQGEFVRYEREVQGAEERRVIDFSIRPVTDEEGEVKLLIPEGRDITEMREAKRRLQRSEQRFRGVFENAALGVALLDEEGHLLETNPAFDEMLGYPTGGVAGHHFKDVTHPDDVATDRKHFEELFTGERDKYQLEKRYLRRDGTQFWGHLTVSRMDGPDGKQIVALVEDIDEQKQRKERLRLFEKIVEQANDAVMITKAKPLDASGPPIVYVNPAFVNITGYETEEVIGESPRILQGPDTEPWVLQRLRNHLERGREFEGEVLNYRKEGTPFVNHWSIAPVYDEDDILTHWVSVQRDLTEEREMAKRLLEIQDEERRRIDREIHDEMGGLLTSLQMTVDIMRMEANEDTIKPERLGEVEEFVSELSRVARMISRRLHPSVLDDYGLFGALPTLVNQFGNDYDLEIDLQNGVGPEDRYSSLIESTVYRVIQEALWNVVRHANTDVAQVTVTTFEHQLRLVVVDEGIGFDPASQEREDTFGLDGMKRRIERLNGKFEIESAPKEGTRISAVLPLTITSAPK